jgi:cation diffusion facilitator family transporter
MHPTDRAVRRVTAIGLILNLILSVLKMTAGTKGGSQALVADGVHSLTDSITDLAVILGSYFWSRPPDDTHPHGHQRLETLVTLFIGAMVLMAGIGIGWQALTALHEGVGSRPGWLALAAAAVSLITKEVLYRWTAVVGRRVGSSAVLANAWHHRMDALSSIPAFLAVAGAMVFPAWPFIDQVGAIVVAIFILQAALGIFRPAVNEILEGGASAATRDRIAAVARDCDGVMDLHHLRTRYLGAGLRADFHLVVDGDISVREGHAIATGVKARLMKAVPDLSDVVVHVEPRGDHSHDHPATGGDEPPAETLDAPESDS